MTKDRKRDHFEALIEANRCLANAQFLILVRIEAVARTPKKDLVEDANAKAEEIKELSRDLLNRVKDPTVRKNDKESAG